MDAKPPHGPFFNLYPLALLAAAFAAGICLATFSQGPLTPHLAGCAVVSVCALTAALWRPTAAFGSWLLVLAFISAGATLAALEKESVGGDRVRRYYEGGRIESGEPVELTGVLERAPEWAPDSLRFVLRAERLRHKLEELPARGRVELFAPQGAVAPEVARARLDALELRRGARVRVLVALTRAERYRNPGVTSLAHYLDGRGLDARGTIKSLLLVERLDDERIFLPLAWLDFGRAWLVARVNELFTPEAAGVLNASLAGNRYGIERETGERFREGGTFHVLVVSGLHVTFVGGLAWWLARLATRRRAWQFASSALVVWAYALAVGAESSVTRAALMFTALALAPVLHRRGAPLNALGAAALALLAWRPADLFDPSFQLTFISVLLLVAAAWPLLSALKSVGEWRPTRSTPYPPACPRWFRLLGEILFWRERAWRRELSRATYSYRLFKTPVAARLERRRAQRLLRYAFSAALASAVVQIGMLPLLVIYFHRFSLASLVLNVFAGAGLAALSLAALAAVFLSEASAGAAAPLVWAVERGAWLLVHSVDPFVSAGVAALRLPEYAGPAGAVYGLYFAPSAILLVALARWRPVGGAPLEGDGAAREGRRSVSRAGEELRGPRVSQRASARRLSARAAVRLAACAFVALFALIVAHPLSAGRPDGRLRVDFLDVGQGDAALVTTPGGATLLVDGGGRPLYDRRGSDEEQFAPDVRGVGEAVVAEYLWWRGLDTIDYVLATHAHADHMDGLADVLDNFRVRAAFVARAPAGDETYRRFASVASARGVPVYVLGAGDTLTLGGAEIDVLWPPRDSPPNSSAASANDDSLVLRLRYGQRTFLLAGDAERRAEAGAVAAASSGAGVGLRSDVVKVAHHGSRTSSAESFVAATRPEYAVISVGLDSQFGHPHAEVLERWRAHGARVLTTGRCGALTFSTDGRDLRLRTHVKDGGCVEAWRRE